MINGFCYLFSLKKIVYSCYSHQISVFSKRDSNVKYVTTKTLICLDKGENSKRCHHCSSKAAVSFRRKTCQFKMFDEVLNYSNVTLVMNDDSLKPDQYVCNCNQTGLCKLGQACCKMLVNSQSNPPSGDKHMCINRHAKLCGYFSHNRH